MSLHGVERFLYELNRDPAKVDQFRRDPESMLSGRALDDAERQWLQAGDVLALYRHGVHPLLLAPASRFFGLDQQSFRDALKPAIGERER